jgi:protein tyrosine/serine phosphatase
MPTVSTRWIEVDGVVNMRELGGLPLSNGGRVPRGVLIRSDNLQDLGASARARLRVEYAVSDVVDLRSSLERKMEGPAPWEREGVIRHHYLSLVAGDVPVGDEAVLGLSWRRPETRRDADFWGAHYLGYLDDRPDSVSAALRAILTARGATVVHCAAGKDRTGVVIAMALDLAGVPREEIVADYLLTAERLDAILQRLEPRPAYGPALAEQPPGSQVPRAAAIESILQAVDDQWGGASGWLREVAGWPTQDISDLRNRLSGRGISGQDDR